MERPVIVEVSTEVQRAEFDDRFGHGRSPAHSGALHAVPNEILAGAFDRTTSNGISSGKVFVIAHVASVVVEVVGDGQEILLVRAGESALGYGLAKAFDDLRDTAFKDAGSHEFGIDLGLCGAFWLEDVSGGPDSVENMDEIENQGRLHYLERALLKSTLTVDQGDESLTAIRIAPQDLLMDFLDHNGLAFGEAGPNPFVSRLGRRLLVGGLNSSGEQVVDDHLRGAHEGGFGEHRGDSSHLLLAGPLFAGLKWTRHAKWWADGFGFDHRDSFAVHGNHKQGSSLGNRIGRALAIETVEIDSSFDQQRFEAVIVNGEAGGFQDASGGFAEGSLDSGFDQSLL